MPPYTAGSIGPPFSSSAGISSRAAAISSPGTILSHEPSITMPSNLCARTMHSTDDAIRSREGSMYLIPSCPSAMPSQGAIVPNTIAVPPADSMPNCTCWVSSFRL